MTVQQRREHDCLGSVDVAADSLVGIHTERARTNFRVTSYRVPPTLLHALFQVKYACAETNLELGYFGDAVGRAILEACEQGIRGEFDALIDLDALQGGAGTSTNMCVNEIIANRALDLLGRPRGDYETVHPIHHANLHQSTNDVYPTAVRLAGIAGLRRLSDQVAALQHAMQDREQAFADIVTMGRTEWQAAVPVTLGREFASFAGAFARDRWRTFKCEERLRVINLGGTAVGTGLTAPRRFIFLVTEKLRAITGFGLTRGENLMDQTANADALVEVSGIVKALAANIVKVCGDLRTLHFTGEIRLPPVQAGSSIMPGKVNPVILECAMQGGLKVMSNDMLVAECASRGSQQIVEFMPLLAFAFLESLDVLERTCDMLAEHCGRIEADREGCRRSLGSATAVITAFLPRVGYERATELVAEFETTDDEDVVAFLKQRLGEDLVSDVLSAESLTALGYR